MSIPPTFPLFFYDKILAIIMSSSHLSCFDEFAQTIINLWPLKSEGERERERERELQTEILVTKSCYFLWFWLLSP